MEKEEYIKAIEELNKEQIQFYNSEEYKKYRNKRHLRKLFRNREYQEIYLTMLKKLEKKKRKKKLKSREIYPITEYITNLENKKKVVYTCVLKNYDKVYSPILTTENTEYIIFSDDKDIVKGVHSWQFRPIPEKVRKLCDNKDILINRYIKMHAKELFPDYDFALYIDGSIRIISDITSVLKKISPKTGLGMHIHPKRTDVYEEAEACIHYNYGNKKKIKELMKRYEKEKVPSQYGLFEATVIAIDLKNPNAEKILENWWEEFFRTETYRDQLTFTYVLWKNKYQMQDIGILGENVAKNLVFRRLQHRKEKQRKKLEDSEIYKKSKKIYDTYFKPIHMLIRKIIYRGKRYQCNICNSKVRKMLDYRNKNEIFTKQKVIGAGYREHVKCPVCRAKDIERMEFFYIQQYTNMLTEKNTILYFFPELEIKRKIRKNKKAIYYDVGDKKIDIPDKIIDIMNHSFEDNQFNYIICSHVLEKVLEEKKAMLEMKRILKPKGKIIIAVPISISNEKTIEGDNIITKEERKKYFGQSDYVRLYGKDFLERIQNYGFQVEEYHFEEKEGIEKSKKYGMLEKGSIYIATKE